MLAQCIIYFFWLLVLDQGTSHRRSCRRYIEKGSFNWKLEWLLPFLIFEKNWEATNIPTTPTSSPNTSNQNFEMTILFSVVDFQTEIMFWRGHSPTDLRARVVRYALGAYKVFIESVVVETWKKARSIGINLNVSHVFKWLFWVYFLK
jgi:hypothetical protein